VNEFFTGREKLSGDVRSKNEQNRDRREVGMSVTPVSLAMSFCSKNEQSRDGQGAGI
jgi:hypothetical protein